MVKPNKIKLSNNFYYEEYFVSDSYPELVQKDYEKNENNKEFIRRLKHHALCIAQPLREHVNDIVQLSSGVRDKYLNEAIGGSSTSDHCHAMAGDMFVPKFINDIDAMKDIFLWSIKNLNYRQLIWYPQSNIKFIHGSINWNVEDINGNQIKSYKRQALVQWEGKYIAADDFFRKGLLDA